MEETAVRTEHMNVEDTEQFIGLFGIREENIPLFKEELGVDIFAHGGEVTLTGEPDKVELARLTLDKLNAQYRVLAVRRYANAVRPSDEGASHETV